MKNNQIILEISDEERTAFSLQEGGRIHVTVRHVNED